LEIVNRLNVEHIKRKETFETNFRKLSTIIFDPDNHDRSGLDVSRKFSNMMDLSILNARKKDDDTQFEMDRTADFNQLEGERNWEISCILKNN
jgi:hypothetical protein